MEQNRLLLNCKEMDKSTATTSNCDEPQEGPWKLVGWGMKLTGVSSNSRRLFQLMRGTGGGELRLVKSYEIKVESRFIAYSKRLTVEPNTLGDSLAGRVLMQLLRRLQLRIFGMCNFSPSGIASRVEHLSVDVKKSAGPNELPLVLLKLDWDVLRKTRISLLRGIWNEKCIPLPYDELLSVSIFKKWTYSDCCIHRGISLISIVTKVLASVMLLRLVLVC